MAKYEVNIDLANETKQDIAKVLETENKAVLNTVGAFASLYDADFKGYKHPVLVLKTEEPGSKQLIAMRYDKIENVSYDMINHLINDCIVMGATPLSVQDAIICGKMDKDIVKRIVTSVSDACKAQGCVLTGGETSEQPKVINEGTYILTSSIVGVVEKDDIIDGAKIEEGDVVLSLESSGIHTNGYTLVRTIMAEKPVILDETVDGRPFIDVILEPHRCYYQALKGLFGTDKIRGLAHITGGGICENLNRILPKNVDASIDAGKYQIPSIFKILKLFGDVTEEEMVRTFNLGVGIALVTKKEHVEEISKVMAGFDINTYEIGVITGNGSGSVKIDGDFNWSPNK